MYRGLMTTVLACLLCLAARAHNYVPDDGTHTGPGTALAVADTTLSQVVYRDHTPGDSQLWLRFEGKAGELFYFQLGVPYLDRLKDYRPALALIGPGMGNDAPPFAKPEGLGATIYDAVNFTPTFFDERFTGTQDWIMFEQELPLPADGAYYLVAYQPQGQAGRLWTTWGRRESFTLPVLCDMHNVIDKVRVFHEVNDQPKTPFTWALHTASAILDLLFFWVK